MSTLQGDLERIEDKVFYGWARGPVGASVTVRLLVEGRLMGEADAAAEEGPADEATPEAGFRWAVAIPDSLRRDEIYAFTFSIEADGEEPVVFTRRVLVEDRPAVAHIDHVRADHVYGWIKPRSTNRRAVIGLWENNRVVSRQVANYYRSEVADAGYGDGRFGFAVPLPLRHRLTPSELELVTVEGQAVRRLQTVYFGRTTIRILIVTDTADVNNASRHYRAVLQSTILWKSGAEVVIVDKSTIDGTSFDNFHVVILQRVPANEAIMAAARRARISRTMILYETDDLNTFPDLVPQMGSIRSRFRRASDPAFANELRGRMMSANLADAILTSNRFMQKIYRQHGFQTILSEFRMDDADICIRRRKPLDSERWRLLYMSGSPTHALDYKVGQNAMMQFANAHEDVSLTVLGDVDAREFKGFDRVRFIGRQTYKQMLETIDEHDCVLAPFERSTFNFGKSCTKFMEAGARGVPLVVSHIPDYVPHVARSGFGLCVRDAAGWLPALEAAYARRTSDYANSGALCQYVREAFSDMRAGNSLFDGIIDMYSRTVCGIQDASQTFEEVSIG